EGLPGEVETGERGVAPLESRDDAQALPVVVEPAHVPRELVEGLLARVPERWMAQVVRQRDRLGQVLVQAQRASDAGGHLGDLERVGEAGAVVVALVVDEHLGLVLEPPERAGVQDAVPVLLERRAVGALPLQVDTPARLAGQAGVRGQRPALVRLELLPGLQHGAFDMALYGSTAWTCPTPWPCVWKPSTTRVG